MIKKLASMAVVMAVLPGCWTGCGVEGHPEEATDWSMDGEGLAVTENASGEEVVWTGLGDGSLCAFRLSSGWATQDTYFDDPVSTKVYDADAEHVLVSTGGLAIVDPDSWEGEPTPIEVEPEPIADARFSDQGVVVLYEDCRVQIDGELTSLALDDCSEGEILLGDTLAIHVDAALYTQIDETWMGEPAVDATWSKGLNAWLITDGKEILVRDGDEIVEVFETDGLVDLAAMGEHIAFRDVDGFVHRISPEGERDVGPWVSVTGSLHDSSSSERIIVERNGAHITRFSEEAR